MKIKLGLNIALVGNAESLFDQNFGQAIDQHDLVVKLNAGTTLNRPQSHGTRCDLAVFSDPMQFDSSVRDISDRDTIIHCSNKNREVEYNISFYKIPLESNNEIKSIVNVDRPSCGLMTLWWLLKYNPKHINVYGFDWKATPTWYTKSWYKQPEKHNYEREREYMLKLAKFKRIAIN